MIEPGPGVAAAVAARSRRAVPADAAESCYCVLVARKP